MKRTAPARRAPLKTKAVLARTSALAPKHSRTSKPKRRPAGIPAQVRAALKLRSGGMCEIAAVGCDGRATEASHRKATGMGGRRGPAAARHHVLSNLLYACSGCHHGQIHAYPANAYWCGWAIRENEDPTVVPVLRRGFWVLLADDGSIHPSDKTTTTDLVEGETL